MEIRVNRGEFLKGIKIVEKAIEENKIKPIISSIYLETDEKSLYFYGTNLELTIITKVDAEVKEQGKIVFQRQIIEEYIKELSDEYINLKVENNMLLLESDDSSTEFSLQNPAEFPKAYLEKSMESETRDVKIKGELLIEAFDKTKFAADPTKDDSRINCIRVEAEEGSLKFVGTDSHRMAYFKSEIENSENFAISIPYITVDAFTKLYRNLEGVMVTLHIGKKNVTITVGDTIIISRMIETPFPDYKGVLSNLKYSEMFLVPIADFLNMIKRVYIFVRKNSESKECALFNIKNNLLEIDGVADIAKISEELPIEYSNELMKLFLNIRYVREFLENCDSSKNIEFQFSNPESSVRFSVEGNSDYIYIMMPVAMKGR